MALYPLMPRLRWARPGLGRRLLGLISALSPSASTTRASISRRECKPLINPGDRHRIADEAVGAGDYEPRLHPKLARRSDPEVGSVSKTPWNERPVVIALPSNPHHVIEIE